VADALEQRAPDSPVAESKLLAECQALGNQYRLQRRIRSSESVSRVLFATALRLARNRDLVEPGAPNLAERRARFAEEIRDAIRRVDAIDALAASRRAGLID
jgi:glycerol-3-phosphate O-acyltransferase